jgi:hypothetical protein
MSELNEKQQQAVVNSALISALGDILYLSDRANEPARFRDTTQKIEQALQILESAATRLSSLEAENRRLRNVLEWYGDEHKYTTSRVKKFFESGEIYTFVSEAETDKGQRARDALSPLPPPPTGDA